MELMYREKFLLALYLEYFDRMYDVNDDRNINIGPGFLNRHVEMQNICYLVQNFNIYLGQDYGFVWDYLGPHSDGLRLRLNDLDMKNECIDTFYDEYNNRRSEWARTYRQQLQDILSEYCHVPQINEIAFSSVVLQDIMKSENGSMILAGMIYLYKTVLPVAEKSRIFEELEKRFGVYGIQLNREFEETVWRDAQIIDLIDIEKKDSVEKQKVLK